MNEKVLLRNYALSRKQFAKQLTVTNNQFLEAICHDDYKLRRKYVSNVKKKWFTAKLLLRNGSSIRLCFSVRHRNWQRFSKFS